MGRLAKAFDTESIAWFTTGAVGRSDTSAAVASAQTANEGRNDAPRPSARFDKPRGGTVAPFGRDD